MACQRPAGLLQKQRAAAMTKSFRGEAKHLRGLGATACCWGWPTAPGYCVSRGLVGSVVWQPCEARLREAKTSSMRCGPWSSACLPA